MTARLRHALAPLVLSLVCLVRGHEWEVTGPDCGMVCARCRLGFGNYCDGRWLSSRESYSDGWPECEGRLEKELSRFREFMRSYFEPARPKP